MPARRTYEWLEEELIISVNMTSLSGTLAAPKSTRLVPPLRWLSSSSAKVKVLQQSNNANTGYMDAIEISSERSSFNGDSSPGSDSDDGMDLDGGSTSALTDYEDEIIQEPGSVSSDEMGLDSSTATIASRIIEITVRKNRAEKCLSTFRKYGFARQDIYRMLNKGPWILSLDISSTLPRLYDHLKVSKCDIAVSRLF